MKLKLNRPRQVRLLQGYGLLPQLNGNILSWSAGFAEQRRLNLVQLHRLAEPKLERESVVKMPSPCSSLTEVFVVFGGEKNGLRRE